MGVKFAKCEMWFNSAVGVRIIGTEKNVDVILNALTIRTILVSPNVPKRKRR